LFGSAATLANRRFLTFAALHERTPGLSGPERMALFYCLPAALQRQAWAALREHCDHAAAPRPDDVLLALDPPDYVEALTGLCVPAGGMVRCPFHADGRERTPSLKVYPDAARGFYCFACGRGGSIYDFASGLWGMATRGEEFRKLRRRLAGELLRAAT
jgi:hypothetical protein